MKAKMLLLTLLLTVTMQARAQWAKTQHVDDYVQYVPAVAALGLDFCGVPAKHALRERILLTGTAFATMTAVAGGLKLAVSEERPDGSDRRSFPSGHAARAFMGAELVRSEYGWGWGAGAYALATGIGVLRVAGDHHYTHDVLAGAAIGVLSTRFAYWVLPLERRILGWEDKDVAVSALPVYQPECHGLGVAVTLTLR